MVERVRCARDARNARRVGTPGAYLGGRDSELQFVRWTICRTRLKRMTGERLLELSYRSCIEVSLRAIWRSSLEGARVTKARLGAALKIGLSCASRPRSFRRPRRRTTRFRPKGPRCLQSGYTHPPAYPATTANRSGCCVWALWRGLETSCRAWIPGTARRGGLWVPYAGYDVYGRA